MGSDPNQSPRRERFDRLADQMGEQFNWIQGRYPTADELRGLPDPADFKRECDYLSALQTWLYQKRSEVRPIQQEPTELERKNRYFAESRRLFGS